MKGFITSASVTPSLGGLLEAEVTIQLSGPIAENVMEQGLIEIVPAGKREAESLNEDLQAKYGGCRNAGKTAIYGLAQPAWVRRDYLGISANDSEFCVDAALAVIWIASVLFFGGWYLS